MSAVELDFGGDFLNHSTKSSGSGFLKAWKEDGSIRVWIHPYAPIFSLWSHRFFRQIVEKDKEGDEVTKTVGMRCNCLEKEALLKKQRFRDNKTDERDIPPAICPVCKMVEWVRAEVMAGNLEWSTPVFKFDSDDSENELTLYAGGVCGLFQKKELTKAELGHLRKAGVKQSEAYKQNLFARQQYVMSVVSAADTDAGWSIAMEGATLGDKLRKTIADEVKRCDGDVEKGHPKYNPYPFEWSYDENKSFDDKYDVVALTRTSPKGAIAELLKDAKENIPDTSRITAEPYLGTLKELMVKHAAVKMPFGEFFEDAFAKYGEKFEPNKDDKEESEEEEKPKRSSKKEESETEETDEESDETNEESSESEELFDCDTCDAQLKSDQLECHKCHTKYEVDEKTNDVTIVSRACANEKCDETVVPTDTGVCPKCGAEHDDDWNAKVPVKRTSKASRKK